MSPELILLIPLILGIGLVAGWSVWTEDKRLDARLERENRIAQGLAPHERCGCAACAEWRRQLEAKGGQPPKYPVDGHGQYKPSDGRELVAQVADLKARLKAIRDATRYHEHGDALLEPHEQLRKNVWAAKQNEIEIGIKRDKLLAENNKLKEENALLSELNGKHLHMSTRRLIRDAVEKQREACAENIFKYNPLAQKFVDLCRETALVTEDEVKTAKVSQHQESAADADNSIGNQPIGVGKSLTVDKNSERQENSGGVPRGPELNDKVKLEEQSIEQVIIEKRERDHSHEVIEQLKNELNDVYSLNEKLSSILSKTVELIRGPPPNGTIWSVHDVPDLVQELIYELDDYR